MNGWIEQWIRSPKRQKANQHTNAEHALQPMTLTILAQILLKAHSPAHFPLARELLLCASALDDPAATITLVNQAVATSRTRHPDIVAPRTHLQQLAAGGNPAAMVLQAELLEAQGKPHAALALCEAAVRTDNDDEHDHDAYTGAEAVMDGEPMTRAWSTLAKLRKQVGDHDGAREALEQGARNHGDPWAYYYLATTYRTAKHPQYVRFLLQAAVSGIPDAAHKLGKYHLGVAAPPALKRAQQGSASSSSSPFSSASPPPAAAPTSPSVREESRLLAREWLAVSAAHPSFRHVDESQVLLALLLRGEGAREEGRALLLKARASPVYGPNAVPWLAERWDGERDFLVGEFLGGGLEAVVMGEEEEEEEEVG